MSKERGFAEIGKRLLSVRGEMDQRGFARHVNVSQQAISNYERGNLPNSWAFLRKLNEDFNVNVNWLLTGQGQRDQRVGSPYASLVDNRPPGWPRVFLEQATFADADPLDLLLHLYFFYLATEPADVKSRLMADVQAVIDAARSALEGGNGDEGALRARHDVYDALSRDDRALAIAALLRLGDVLETHEERESLVRARRLCLAALTLARLQGWVEQEVEAARRVGRTFRKEGRWSEAERFYRSAVERLEQSREGDADPVPDTTCSRTWLGFGHVAKEQGAFGEARERYTRALEWALRSPQPSLRAEVYLDLGCLAFHERDLSKALEFVNTGRAFAEQAEERRLVADFKLAEAVVLRQRGDLATAQAILAALLQQAERDGDPRLVAIAGTNLAEVLVDQGELGSATDLLERLEETTERHASPRTRALRKLVRARLAAARGEEDAARTLALECLRYARGRGLSTEFDQAAEFLRAGAPAASREVSAG